MKISIITVVYNNQSTIAHAIDSVLSQDYPSIEYIIVDGASTDRTVEVIQSYGSKVTKFISEPDRGIYDAMNKGIQLATGDIIGILNSDDFYENNQMISRIVGEFEKHPVDLIFGDVIFVRPDNLERIVRYYSSENFHPWKFAWGWMPAHPSCYFKRQIYEKYGYFKTDYKIASDYELLVRFMAKYKITYRYIPQVFVKMRTGGISTRDMRSNLILNQEIVRACQENGIRTNLLKVFLKYFIKIFQIMPLSPRKN